MCQVSPCRNIASEHTERSVTRTQKQLFPAHGAAFRIASRVMEIPMSSTTISTPSILTWEHVTSRPVFYPLVSFPADHHKRHTTSISVRHITPTTFTFHQIASIPIFRMVYVQFSGVTVQTMKYTSSTPHPARIDILRAQIDHRIDFEQTHSILHHDNHVLRWFGRGTGSGSRTKNDDDGLRPLRGVWNGSPH